MKKLLGLLLIGAALNASALHIPTIYFGQNNWVYDWTLVGIYAVDGEHDFTLWIGGQFGGSGPGGIGARSTYGLFPVGGNVNPSLEVLNFFLHAGTYDVRLTYYDGNNNFIETFGPSYTVLPTTGERPLVGPGSLPDGGGTMALLGLGLLGLALLRHGCKPVPPL